MTPLWLRQVDAQLRCLVPLATGLIATLVDALPLPGPGFEAFSTFTLLAVVYFWSLYRPDLMTPTAVFLLGLIHDALAGLPLGMSSLALLLVRSLIVGQKRFFLARAFPVIWACFVLLAPLVELARWLLASLWFGHLFALDRIAFELAVTLALYPPISAVLGRLHGHVPRLIYAS